MITGINYVSTCAERFAVISLDTTKQGGRWVIRAYRRSRRGSLLPAFSQRIKTMNRAQAAACIWVDDGRKPQGDQ